MIGGRWRPTLSDDLKRAAEEGGNNIEQLRERSGSGAGDRAAGLQERRLDEGARGVRVLVALLLPQQKTTPHKWKTAPEDATC
ncbi:unnamed protein product [Linum trigynum]|uniref:Uncharacterized protein n=1 Tax=Linum trigynum TaxID=586398 RepID=A0AAV2CMG7_9ROSI